MLTVDGLRVVLHPSFPQVRAYTHPVRLTGLEHDDDRATYHLEVPDRPGTRLRAEVVLAGDPWSARGWNGTVVDDVLDGQWSLKSHAERAGLAYRTAPHTLPLRSGHRYRVGFDYQCARAGYYTGQTGLDVLTETGPVSTVLSATPIQAAHRTTRFTHEFQTPGHGWAWIGVGPAPTDPHHDTRNGHP